MVAAPGRTSPSRLLPPFRCPTAARAAARRGGRFRSALAGGLVSALLVGGGAFALGVVDDDARDAASASSGPALVGAKQTGDVAAIYAAARDSVVSIKTNDGSGTGFVVDADGTIVTNAHVVGVARRRVAGAVRRRRDRDRARDGRRPLVRPRRASRSTPAAS